MGSPQNLIFALVHLQLLFLLPSNGVVSEDKSVLLEFKSSVSDPKGLLSSWTETNKNHCTWAGVFCDLNSRVVAINVTGNGNSCSGFVEYPLYWGSAKRGCEGDGKLVGKLSGLVGKLSELKILSLPFNGFTGMVPGEVWGMGKLEVLDLEGNSLSGSIPVSRVSGGLRSLRVLNLGFNRIGGEVPEWLSGLDGLEVLNLARNRVSGSVPGWVGKLREVYLGYNELGGEVDEKIGDGCGKLEHLDLSGNFLTGRIPRSLGNCSRLRSLLLYSNLFDDVVPTELGRLRSLEVLDLSGNSLSGSIPVELGNCSELSVLVLSNMFNPLPNVSSRKRGASMDQLNSMSDDFNYFQGGLPSEVIALPNLRVLWAPRATLQGRFPSNWSSCGSLEMINLAQNFFTGEISHGLANCKKLFFLDLSSNRLSGLLPEELPVPCMTFFVVRQNMLSGPIPQFSNASCYPLSFMNGRSSDNVTLSLVHVYQSFFAYKAQEASPWQMLGQHGSLGVYHDFGRNNFSGNLQSMPIAPERANKQTAYAINLRVNKLNGPFPNNFLGSCSRLFALLLDVSSNRIYGHISADIGKICKPLILLDASGNQLTGPIPTDIGELVSLVALNLSNNLLQGQLPPSIGDIKGLKNLSLAGNNLTGSIPTSLGQLHSLEVLELSSNSLSGEIPDGLVKLMNLTSLLLNNNKLSGKIPSGLEKGASLSAFNLSYNNLSGPIPPDVDFIKCNSVLGNPLLQTCHTYTLSASPSDPQESVGNTQGYDSASSENQYHKSGSSGFNSIEIASIASASVIVSVLIALIILFIYTRKWKPRSRISSIKREVTIFMDIGAPLTYESIVQATGSFHASNCIGFGAFGSTYKAEIAPEVVVAIKRLAVGRFQGVQQFEAEIKTLGRLRHSNLVTLIGYHASETEMFLIYNYLPGGNLQKFIQERSTKPVQWRILHKIALDIARALAYLHDTCVPRVLHRDVKPNNILLDDKYNAYLSDFGLARLLGTSETHATTAPAGTFGYVAPEYAMTCRVSDKADVYSYGVVLLELLSDKKVLDPSFSVYGSPFNIVQWAGMLLRHGRAKEFFTAGLWDEGPHEDLIEVLHLAIMCTVESLSIRPTMRQVVRRLKQLHPPSTC